MLIVPSRACLRPQDRSSEGGIEYYSLVCEEKLVSKNRVLPPSQGFDPRGLWGLKSALLARVGAGLGGTVLTVNVRCNEIK